MSKESVCSPRRGAWFGSTRRGGDRLGRAVGGGVLTVVVVVTGCYSQPEGDRPATSETNGLASSDGPSADESSGGDTAPPDTGAPTSTSSSTGSAGGESDESGESGTVGDPELLGWYTLDEIAAPNIVDSSSHGFDGTCVGDICPTEAVGRIGGAATFDGVDDIVVVPPAPEHGAMAQFTVAVWVCPTRAPTAPAVAFGKVFEGGWNAWQLNLFADLTPFVAFYGERGSANARSRTPLPLDTWTHVAATWDGSVVRLWVDGVVVAFELVAAISFGDGPLTLGADLNNGNAGNFFPGLVDDARIYTRALTAEEIEQLAQVGR